MPGGCRSTHGPQILTILSMPAPMPLRRTTSKVSVEDGVSAVNRGVRCPMRMDVMLKDQHEGYISWSESRGNQQVIADNATVGQCRGQRSGAAAIDSERLSDP